MSFRAGTTTLAPMECARDAMVALSAAGFQQNLQISSGAAPNQAASGYNASAIGMIACLQKGDIFLVVHSMGSDADALVAALAQKMNETLRRH